MVKDRTVFLQVFGEDPIFKVLDFLVVNEDFDYSMTDIARLSNVGYSTLKLFWGRIEDSGIVMNTRTVGKAKMYRLDLANPAVRKFREFYWAVTKHAVRSGTVERATVKTSGKRK